MSVSTRLCEDVSSAQWVADRIHDFGQDVGSIIPEGFDDYLRLFHPASRAQAQQPVRWAQIAAANDRLVHPEMQWPNISGVFEHDESPDPEVWDHGPDVGSLPQDHAPRLADTLKSHTNTPDRVWFCVWDGWGGLVVGGHKPQVLRLGGDTRWRRWRSGVEARRRKAPAVPKVRLPGRDYYLFEGPIAAITESLEYPPFWQSANLWWPDDRAWSIATEIDFGWTYVGGSVDCVQAVASTPEFETISTSIDHGITYASDKVNPPPT